MPLKLKSSSDHIGNSIDQSFRFSSLLFGRLFGRLFGHKLSRAFGQEFSRGFTLIEIMIVLVIIGAILGLAVPKLANSKNKIKDEVKHIALLSKEVHNAARLENRTYRIVFSMEEKKAQSYWVESAAAGVTLLNDDQKKKLKEADKKKSLIAQNNGFEVNHSILKDSVKLPKQLFIDQVEYADKRVISSGSAAVHFFAQGLVQEVAIHLSDRKSLVWTIYISPLTAHTVVFEKNISLKEIETR